MENKKRMPKLNLDNATNDTVDFFKLITEKYNSDVQASMIMLLVDLVAQDNHFDLAEFWASLVTAASMNFRRGRRRKN
jgi:hypothetical protein